MRAIILLPNSSGVSSLHCTYFPSQVFMSTPHHRTFRHITQFSIAIVLLVTLPPIFLSIIPSAAQVALAIDASTPAIATETDRAITSASFSPPDSSLLLVCAFSDSIDNENVTITMSNNGAALTWTEIVSRDGSEASSEDGNVTAAYTLLTTGRTGMTVTATSNTTENGGIALKVYVITGHDTSSPIGASGEGSSQTNSISPTIYTSTVNNSRGFGCAEDWNALGSPTSTDTEDPFHSAGNLSGLAAYKASDTATSGTAVTMNFDASGTGAPAWNWAGVEVKPANSGTPDTTPPTVSMTAPANGATASGTISVAATASDNVGVSGVQFLLDGTNLSAEDTAAPYALSWNTTTASNGSHTLSARARDAAGNVTLSTSVTVTVSNVAPDTAPPTVSMTAPANGATVSGTTVPVTANASDNVGVSGVQFLLDGANLGVEDTISPYSISWNTTTATNGSHTLTARARDAAGNVTTSTVVTVTVSNGGGGTSLTIDGNVQFQVIDGFGVSVNAHSWDGGELRPALDLLVDQNGSTIFRVITDEADWEATNDNADPNTYNWTYYNSLFTTPKFEELWATMAYLNQKGITGNLMLNFMGRGPLWNGGSDLPTAASEDEWVETVTAVASYARNNRGLQFGLFAPTNEPDWDIYEGVRMDQFQLPRVFEKLANKLDAIGLSDVRIVGPDTAAICGGVSNYVPEMTGNATVMNKLDHFSFHNYTGDSCGAAAAMPPGKNFWITEVTNIWDAMTHMSQGPSAILIWDGYDSVYNHAIRAGRGSSPPNDAGNGPALLDYDTGTRTYTQRKAFYEFAQLFKFVPGGSRRIAANEGNGNVTIYAFHHPTTGRVTIVGRNAGAGDVNFSATLANLPAVPTLEFYVTDNSNNFTRGSDIPVSGNAFSFTAPGNSVFTLTFSGTPDTTPPTVSMTAPANGATVSGTAVSVTANASDNVGVSGVQFLLDGVNLSAEDTISPYSVSWNTTTASNGSHALSARARDAAGNVTTATVVTVTVSNPTSSLLIHPSSPARVAGVPALNGNVTTASFTPPASSLLLVMVSSDCGSTTGDIDVGVSDSTTQTWTQIVSRDPGEDAGAEGGHASAWYALKATSQPMTVSVRRTVAPSCPADDLSFKVYVVTGHSTSSPIGASGEGSSVTNNFTPTIYTSTVNNSLGFGVATDWNALGLPSSTDTEHAAHYSGSISVLSAYKASALSPPGTAVPTNFDAFGTSAAGWNWVGFEVKPGN